MKRNVFRAIVALVILASQLSIQLGVADAGSIPSFKARNYFNSAPVYRYYFVAMFSNATSQKNDGSWTNGTPGVNGTDLSTLNGGQGISFPYDFTYDKRVKSVTVTPFNQAFLNGKSDDDKKHWVDVFNDSRPESWTFYRDKISQHYGATIQNLTGLGTKTVSFSLKLTPGSRMDAPDPKVDPSPGGNRTETHYFPMLLTIDVEPTLEVRYFTKDGQSLDSVFGNYEKTMTVGSSYTVTPPTNPKYTYVGYKESTGDAPPSGGSIQSGTFSFTYDGSYDTRYVNLYYDTMGSGTINVRHMVRTGSTGTYTQAGTDTIPVASLPATQTVTPSSSYGSVQGSSLSYSAFSDSVTKNLSQTVNLTSSQRTAYVTFFYQKDSSGIQADFDIVPNTIKYGEKFSYVPKNMQVGSCKYNYTKFRTQKGSLTVDSEKTPGIFTGLNFSKPSEYPSVVTGPGTYDVMMLVNSSCGDTWVGPKTLTVTSDEEPQPTPTPSVNNPPFAAIAFYDHFLQTQTTYVEQGRFVDLKVVSMSDPDPGDTVTIQSWDMSDWINDSPPGGTKQTYTELSASKVGTHTVYLTVVDSKGETYTAKTQLTIVKSDPVAVISGAGRVKEGRPLNPPLESKSYSPMGYPITEEHWTNKHDSYPNVGEETVTLWVKDDHGNTSETATHTIEVIPDEPPVVTLDVPQEETRLGNVVVKANAFSPDEDQIANILIQMKYDAKNNGFDDDAWQTVQNGLSDTYSFKPAKVGKYLFRAVATEDYGKTGNTDDQPEASRTLDVLNLAPSIDVVTSSDQTGPPDRTSLSIGDIYNGGTVYSLDNGAASNKVGWDLKDGFIESKLFFNDFSQFSYQNYYNGVYTDYYGNKQPNQSLYASIQNTPTLTPVNLHSSGENYFVADEKALYVMSRDEGVISAFDKNTLSLLWRQSFDWISHNVAPYGFLVKGERLYVEIITGFDRFSGDVYALDRNSGTLLNHIQFDNPNGYTFLAADNTGIILRNNLVTKYDFNLNKLFDYPNLASNISPDRPEVILNSGNAFFSTMYTYPIGGTNGVLGGSVVYRPDGTIAGTIPYSTDPGQGFINQVVGVDSNGNVVAALNATHDVIAVYDKDGRRIKSFNNSMIHQQKPNSNNSGSQILGLDSQDNIIFLQTGLDCSLNYSCTGRSYIVDGVNESGQTVYSFQVMDPADTKWAGSIMSMTAGADGLVNLFGFYKDTSNQKVYMKVFVYDPKTKAVVRNDMIDTGLKDNQTLSVLRGPGMRYVQPLSDQRFVVFFLGYDNSGHLGYQTFILSSSGPLQYPNPIVMGTNKNEILVGSNIVPHNESFNADLIAQTSTTKGVGYAYLVQDARNYYSAEFEDGQLKIKKTVNGAVTTVFSKAYSLVPGQTYSFKFVPTSGGFSLYVNRLKQADISESGWTTGRIGFISRGQGAVDYGNLYLEALSGATVGSISGVALVGQTIQYTVTFDDPEKDPRITAGETWTYTHNPNVFLNPQGTWSGSGKAQSAPITAFDLPGEYTFKFKTRDDPNPSYLYPLSNFDDYRQNSNEVTGVIRVHRRPIADLSVTVDSNGKLTYTDRSYDPDRYNPSTGQYSTENTGIDYAANHGVLDRKFRYRSADSSTYTEGKPDYLSNGTYYIEEAVVDEYGAWSDWAQASVTVKGVSRVPPSPGFTVEPDRTYRGAPVTIDSYASDPVDGDRTHLTHAYYMKNLTTGSAESFQSDSRTTWTKTFSSLGIFNIRQVVTNSAGLSAEANHTVEIYNRLPEVTVTTPASSVSSSPTVFAALRPQFVWTYTDADGDPQSQYQVLIYDMNGQLVMDSGVKSGSAENWTAAADLPAGKTMYVTVHVFDGYDWSNWSTPKYFYINRPPTGDFTWNPQPVYEGDTVTFVSTVDDPDKDTLDVTYEIESPTGEKQTFRYTWDPPYPKDGPTLVLATPGEWTATLTVSDRLAPPVTVVHTLSVLPLTIAGQVKHTDAWEANRIRYNQKHPNDQRPADWFWAGEAFVLEAVTTDTGESATKAVEVTADAGGGLRKALTAADAPVFSRWGGMLLGEDVGMDLSKLPEGDYTFVFQVKYSNGVIKTDPVTITIKGTVDEYVQVHRVQ